MVFVSDGKDICSVEMEDVELGSADPGTAETGIPITCKVEVVNNLDSEVSKSAEQHKDISVFTESAKPKKEKTLESVLDEDVVDGVVPGKVGSGAGEARDALSETRAGYADALSELDIALRMSHCAVPNSDSGFVDQSSVTSASNPDIKACSLTSPPEGPVHPAPGYSVTGMGIKSMMSAVVGHIAEASSKMLELTELKTQRSTTDNKASPDNAYPSNTVSPNDSSPGSSGQQRSPSQQGWFAPPSPSIAPAHPRESSSIGVTAGVRDKGLCQVTTATKTQPCVSVKGAKSKHARDDDTEKPIPPPRTSSKQQSHSPCAPKDPATRPEALSCRHKQSKDLQQPVSTSEPQNQNPPGSDNDTKKCETPSHQNHNNSSNTRQEDSDQSSIKSKQYSNSNAIQPPTNRAQPFVSVSGPTTQEFTLVCEEQNQTKELEVKSPPQNQTPQQTSPTDNTRGSTVSPKPLSAIPGRVSRLHHQMEQRKYGSFSSGSSSSGSSSSSHEDGPSPVPHGHGTPATEPSSNHAVVHREPSPPEIPKRTFLKDSGLPTNGAKASRSEMTQSHPPAVSRVARPSSASNSNAHASSAKRNLHVTKSAPGSPTRAVVASSTRGIPTAKAASHVRCALSSSGSKPSAEPSLQQQQQQTSARTSSLRSNSSASGSNLNLNSGSGKLKKPKPSTATGDCTSGEIKIVNL